MSDIDKILTKGELFAQGHVLLALIATHPDIQILKRQLQSISERHMAKTLAGEQSDSAIGAYQVSLERWLLWMDMAAANQGTKTTPSAQDQ